jgi:serine acetyltransferase
MKGVTIGEGAVIGANSVVISDVPDYALALGNPAQVLIRGFGKPSTARKAALPQADQSEQEKAVIASDPS